MAINVNVPGVGNISVEGAASERTLQELVSAINGSNRRQDRGAAQTASDLKGIGQSAAAAGASMQETASSSRQAKSAMAEMASSMSDSIIKATGQYQVNTDTVGQFAQNLLSTSTQISREWTRAFTNLATGGLDPIAAAASTFRAGIDGASAVVGGMSKVLGPTGGALARTFTALGASVGKAGIDVLKEQLVGSVRAMERYNKMGAIFSEGLGDMRVSTGKTGLSFDQFSRVVESNRDIIKSFGGTLSDGITRLADVSSAMGKTTDSSGKTVRNALLNLGYSVEDQTALAASYLAQQRSIIGIEKTRAMSSKEVATATAKYATDLKVLQELTGKDAKAIADKAAKDTMRASLMAKLDVDQRKSLTQAFQGLASLPPDAQQNMQQALTRYLTTGTFDPAVAMSEEMREYITKIGDGVKSGSTDMQDTTTKATEELKKQLEAQARTGTGLASTADTIVTAGGQLSGAVQTYTTMVNGILSATTIEAGATEKSRDTANKLKDTTDVLTTNVSKMTEQSARITSSFNNIATEALPKVAPAVTGLVTGVANASAKLEQAVITGKGLGDMLSSLRNGILSVWGETAKEIKRSLDEYFGVRRQAGGPAGGPSRDTGTLGMTGKLFEVNDFYGKIAKGETVLTQGQLENLVSGVSGATIGSPAASPMQSMQDGLSSMVSAMQSSQQKAASNNKQSGTTESLPTAITEALSTLLTGPTGFASVMETVKNQLSDNNDKQLGAMQEQISKLNDLVTAMQDNVRASENIANAMS